MILSAQCARREVKFNPEPINSGYLAIDLRLDKEIKYPDYGIVSNDGVIHPHERIHGLTIEEIDMPNNLTALITGKSSHMREGLVMPTGWIKPGFAGKIYLEIWNMSRDHIEIPVDQPIAQLVFCRMEDAIEPYDGKYNGQTLS